MEKDHKRLPFLREKQAEKIHKKRRKLFTFMLFFL